MPSASATERHRAPGRLWEPPRQVIQQLSFLSGRRCGAARQRLIQAHKLLAGPIAEQESFVSDSLQKQVKSSSKKSLAAIKEERKAVDVQIDALIQGAPRLRELFCLIVSVPGAGPATATEILVSTNEMKAITSAKKMACHAGVAPFDGVARAIPFGDYRPRENPCQPPSGIGRPSESA